MIKKYKDENGYSHFFAKKGGFKLHVSSKRPDSKDKSMRIVGYLMWFAIYSLLISVLVARGLPFNWIIFIGVWIITVLIQYICEHAFFD